MFDHALTVDVEDYFHVSALAEAFPPDSWDKQTLRAVNSTELLLDLFGERGIQATFFVLGWLAEREKGLVKKIHAQGHEVASHGYSHQLVYSQQPDVFREETLRSKSLLEDLTGAPVTGYRAASYSITQKSLWALDVLCELGFQYDSSIFPVYHDRYGIPNTPRAPYRLRTLQGHELVEFPISTVGLGSYSLPIAGGGYFRIFPYWFSRWGLQRSSHQTQSPFVFYLHPWEVDPGQPRVKTNWLSQFRHYTNLSRCENRLIKLMKDFSFTRMDKVLERCQLGAFDLSSIAAEDPVVQGLGESKHDA